MSHLGRQIRSAQRRLWLNRWLHVLTTCVAIACALLALLLAIQRSYDLPWPMGGIVLSCAGLAILASFVWFMRGRERADEAAARLDQAAGLHERLSSGRYCTSIDDSFARAVVADAERISASITARRHLPLTPPGTLPWLVAGLAMIGLTFLLAPGWLLPEDEARAEQLAVRVEQTRNEVEKKLEPLKRLAEVHPILEEYREEIDALDRQAGGQLRRPDDVRHEAVKKIDNLSDAVRERRDDEKYETVREMRQMLRRVAPTDAPTDRLTQALARSQFELAKQEIENIKEQLATLQHENDRETVKKISEQLEKIAEQIQKASEDQRLAEDLKNAGLSEEQTQCLLESLSKLDLDQLKKELAEKGLSERQIEQLARQLQQKQGAIEATKQLAQKLGQAAAAAAEGQSGDAQSALSQTGQQLSELEQLEQEMNQLDSALAALEGAKGEVGRGEGEGEGAGEGGTDGQGGRGDRDGSGQSGMGSRGQGRGGLASEEHTDVGFKTERGTVPVGQGGTTGQFLVEGEQVPGEVGASVAEVVTASERDASDRIKRDRIPRQYQPAVKAYFSNVQRSVKELKPQPTTTDEASPPERETAPNTDKD